MAYNILIVDDSRTMRAVIAKTLAAGGVPTAEVHEAANGREALEKLDAAWIDLVLTDLHMPEMDGEALVARMAERDLMGATPVVVVSTEGGEERIEGLKAHGIAGYLRKPFTPEDLKQLVDHVLGGSDDEHAGGLSDRSGSPDF
jgi:two-component system chemotaxis response regulator CheY